MIEPTHADIGRAVMYTGNRYPGGKLESGVITSFNANSVFVRYRGDLHSKGTSRTDLMWEFEAPKIDPRDPDHSRTGMFVLHNCWKCQDGKKPCVRGAPRQCEYPRARND